MGAAFYCGVWPGDDGGHFTRPPSGWPSWLTSRDRRAQEHGCPLDLDCDDYLPRGDRRAGVAKITHVTKAGKRWTVLAMHDYTGDDRPGSHSSFALEGEHAFEAAVHEARRWFPAVFARLQAAHVRIVEAG